MTSPGGPVAAQVEWVRLKPAGPAARGSTAPSSPIRTRSASLSSGAPAALPPPVVNRKGPSAPGNSAILEASAGPRERQIGQDTEMAADVNRAEAERARDSHREASQSFRPKTIIPPRSSSVAERPPVPTDQASPTARPAAFPQDRKTRTLTPGSTVAMLRGKAPFPADLPAEAREGAPDDVNAGGSTAAPPPVPKGGEPGPVRPGKPEAEERLSPLTVSLLDLDAGFRLLTPVRPRFPQRAARAQRSGQVQLEVLVDADGSVARVEVMGEPEGWGFGLAAREAFAQARFTPPTASGRPVRVRWRKTFLFRP